MCFIHQLWASVDFGETWHVLEYRVQGYHWSGEGTTTVLYVQREDPSATSAVLAYSNFSPDARYLTVDSVSPCIATTSASHLNSTIIYINAIPFNRNRRFFICRKLIVILVCSVGCSCHNFLGSCCLLQQVPL